MKIAEMSVSSLSLALDNFIDHKIHESLVAAIEFTICDE